jgi:hypothetical protein
MADSNRPWWFSASVLTDDPFAAAYVLLLAIGGTL